MMPIPSRRLVQAAAALVALSLAVLVLPRAWLVLAALDSLLVLAALLDLYLTPGPRKLEARRVVADPMSVLNEIPVALLVRNRSRSPLQIRLRDSVPESLVTPTEEVAGSVPAQAEVRWEYLVKPTRRGLFSWGSIQLRFRSLLGLWELRKEIDAPQQARVYPNLAALYRYALLARTNRLNTMGVRRVRLRGGAWEFESLRDYVGGDDVRLLDWKASARRRKLIVRNQEAERNQTVLLLLDCGRLMNAEVDGSTKLDYAVNTALILAHVALARGDRVGLCTFSHRVHSWVAPRPNLGHMHLITEALFNQQGNFSETDHARCLRLLAARHRKRALLVVLTDFVDAETGGEMIAHLHQASRRHVVLFTAFKDPYLEEAARQHPRGTLEAFRKSVATDLLRERLQVMERLRQMGAHVLDVEPAGVTPPLLNRYLEITFRGLL
jgi:uncharacterized protein (DUF58 family)